MGLPITMRHSKNPFMEDLIRQSKKKQALKHYSADGNKFMIVNTSNPTDSAKVTAFGTSEEVEMNRFVKLYADGVGGIMGLNNAGKKVFALLFMQLRGSDGKDKDEVTLNYALIPEETKKQLKLSQTTFYRGVKELIKQNFIAATMAINVYYINPTFIFNGDRLVVMHQYLLREEKEALKSMKKMEDKVRTATTVNIPPEKPETENDLFEDQKNEMKTQLTDGRKFDAETGEILEDVNGNKFQQLNLFSGDENE